MYSPVQHSLPWLVKLHQAQSEVVCMTGQTHWRHLHPVGLRAQSTSQPKMLPMLLQAPAQVRVHQLAAHGA